MVPAGLMQAIIVLLNGLNNNLEPAVYRARLLLPAAMAKIMDLGEMRLQEHRNELHRNRFPSLDVPLVCQMLPDIHLPSYPSGVQRPNIWKLTYDCICEERNRLHQLRLFWSPNVEMYAGGANATSTVNRYIQEAIRNSDTVLAHLVTHVGGSTLVCNHVESQPTPIRLGAGERCRRDYAVAESTQRFVDTQARIVTYLKENLSG